MPEELNSESRVSPYRRLQGAAAVGAAVVAGEYAAVSIANEGVNLVNIGIGLFAGLSALRGAIIGYQIHQAEMQPIQQQA